MPRIPPRNLFPSFPRVRGDDGWKLLFPAWQTQPNFQTCGTTEGKVRIELWERRREKRKEKGRKRERQELERIPV